MVFVLWSSLNHTPIKYKGPIKKSTWITPAHLMKTYWFFDNNIETYFL